MKEIVPHARRDPAYFATARTSRSSRAATTTRRRCRRRRRICRRSSPARLHIRQKPGPEELARPREVHLPERRQRLHARHAGAAAVLAGRAAISVTAASGWRIRRGSREWVLRDQPEWTRERIEAAMQGERPTRVNLKQPLTVVLFYDTVHVNSEGVVFFVDDIYGHDRELDAALKRGYPYPVKA